MDSTNVVASAARLYWCVLLKVLALYYEKMLFTLDHTRTRRSVDSIDNTTEDDANENNENEEYVVGQDGFLSSNNSTQSSTSTGSGIYHGSTLPKKQKTCKNTNLSTEVVMKEASHAVEAIPGTMKHNFNRNNTITPNEAFANFVMTKLSHIPDENVRLDVEQEITMKL
jgi:hypothetical protein